MVEKAHEADFRRALRVGAVVARAIEHQRARRAGRAVGAESELVEEANRERAAATGLEIEVEHFGLDLARSAPQRRQKRRAVAGDQVAELKSARPDLGKILIEPIGQRRVEVDHLAFGIDGKKAGRRMIEIVDGVLQFLKDVFLPVALARHVAERPDGEASHALAVAQRAHAQPQPARRPALCAGDAHLLLQALAFARRLEQPVDRFGRVRIVDEHPFHRTHVVRVRRVDEIEIGGIGVKHAAVTVGDDQAVNGIVDDGLDQRAAGFGRRQPQDAAGKREQRKYPDRGQYRQEAQDVRLGGARAEHHNAGCGGNQHPGHQQHQNDTAGPRRIGAAIDRPARGAGGTLGHAVRRHSCPEVDRCRLTVVPCATSAQERLRNTAQRPRPARRAARTQDLAGNLGDAVRSTLRATIETIGRVMTAEACGTAAHDALALARCTGADLAGGMVNGRLRGVRRRFAIKPPFTMRMVEPQPLSANFAMGPFSC